MAYCSVLLWRVYKRGGRQIWRLFLDSNNDVRAPHETTQVVVIKLNKIGKQKQTGGQVVYILKDF